MIYQSIAETAKWRIRHNKNYILAMIGATGSGKSWGALYLAKKIDPNFTLDNVCFSPRKFIEIINDHFSGKRTLPKGSVIIVEEAGVQFSARSWMTFNNKMLGMIAQSFRSLNWVIIFTLPNFAWFEKQARELCHLVLIAKKIDFEKSKAFFLVRELHVDNFTGEMKPFYPWIKKRNGEYSRVKFMALGKPDEKLCDDYEDMKLMWQVGKYKDLYKSMGEYEAKKVKKRQGFSIL